MRFFSLTLLILGPLLAAPVLAAAGRPVEGARTLLVVGPSHGLTDILRRAGGRPIGPTQAPMALLAVAETHPETFAERLKTEGAWLVVDGAIAARICGA
ncbi:hypothetical protein [Tropicimonas sp. IMCC34011]|uniref:hypothetical protein n=1 Tax=Tropicimonas sp. IMCC34011 TaxID=2248759 RepID=UPI000E2618A6|nr:hypothetical protein [Tropicimonas sp. IMCC34011]